MKKVFILLSFVMMIPVFILGADVTAEETPDEIKLADKAVTAKYNLTVVNSMLPRINELLVQFSNDTNTDLDKEAILIEINSLIEHINWIYDTSIYGDKLFSNQDYDNIAIGKNKISFNLSKLSSDFPEKVVGATEQVKNAISNLGKTINSDLNEVNTVIESLQKNNIFGHNHSDFAYEQAQTLIKYVQTEESNLSEVHSILQRQNELLVKLANTTFSEYDFEAIKKEYTALNDESKRLIDAYLEDKTYPLNNKETIIKGIDEEFIKFTNKELTIDNVTQLIDELKEMLILISLTRSNLGAIQNTAEHYYYEQDVRYLGKLTITKKLSNTKGDCYVGVFDEDNKLIQVFKVELKDGSETFNLYLPIFDDKVTYIIRETDKDGNDIEESNLLFDRKEIIFTPSNLHENITITEKLVENPEMGIGNILIIVAIGILTLVLVYFYFRRYNRFSDL